MKTPSLILLVACGLLVGCSTSDIVKMDKDTYFIQKRVAQVGFGPPEGAKAEVYAIANQFCEERGMALETVKLDVVNAGFGRPASVALQFRCVPISQAVSSEEEPETPDEGGSVEERLKKISDLRDKGIITEEEYQQKRSEIITSI